MQKLYKIVVATFMIALLFVHNNLQAQKCCVECQADVKVMSDEQVLLEKIDLKAGNLTTNVNTNLYVSYRSGNSQKFWTNLVIATAGVAVSTQLSKANLAEGKSTNGVSPLLPLGVSVATLPSIWKNRPRGIPQAGLWIQHRDTRGKLLETWEQPITNEAKNDAELLTVSIDKPLTAGTLEVYLQNGSKNGVYYWGYKTTSKSAKPIFQSPTVSSSMAGCPDGYLPNGNGQCCNPFTGECVSEGGGTQTTFIKTETRVVSTTTGGGGGSGGCPDGYLPNGNGMCCNPFTGDCISESQPSDIGIVASLVCVTTTEYMDYYSCSYTPSHPENGMDCTFMYSTVVSTSTTCYGDGGDGTGGGGTGGGTGGGGGGTGGGGPKTCINGRDQAGNPCGASICGTNGFDQYGAKCGRNCNSTTGFDQFNDPCGPSICGAINPSFTSSKQARISSVVIDQYGDECANYIINEGPPDRVITDINKELKCFSLTQGAKITIYADQPQNNSRKAYRLDFSGLDVGHSFISIEQNGIVRVIGFYPKVAVDPYTKPSTNSVLIEDSSHEYDVAISTNVSSQTLVTILNQVKSHQSIYNLNTFNCTDFASSIATSAGIIIADTNGTWPGGGGSNPGDFGQDIRSVNNSNVQKVTQTGNAPSNSGSCN